MMEDNVVGTEVFLHVAKNDMLHLLAQNACQRNWSIIYRIAFAAFLVCWSDKSGGPGLWEFAGGVSLLEYMLYYCGYFSGSL